MAVPKHPGALKAKAAKAGMSTAAFAKANIHASGTVGKQARLAYTLSGMHGAGKSNMSHAGDKRTPAHKLYNLG